MRLILFTLLSLILTVAAAEAQSIMDNLPQQVPQKAAGSSSAAIAPTLPAPTVAPINPPAPIPSAAMTDPFTVTDVTADVTADTAAHARDQALIQAEHAALAQLCARQNMPDSAAKISDDAVASLVQSFDVQSERLSAVRYIGVFTIHFKAAALQKKIGHAIAGVGENVEDDKATALSSAAHLTVAVQTPSLPAWTQTKRRLGTLPQVVSVDTIDLGRGLSHIDLRYTGALEDLQTAMIGQGLVLRQAMNHEWELVESGAP